MRKTYFPKFGIHRLTNILEEVYNVERGSLGSPRSLGLMLSTESSTTRSPESQPQPIEGMVPDVRPAYEMHMTGMRDELEQILDPAGSKDKMKVADPFIAKSKTVFRGRCP